MQLFKFLSPRRKSPYRRYQYPPVGEWAPALEGEPVKEQHGYHLARPRDLPRWIQVDLWRVEVLSPARIIKHHDCVVTTSPVRLVERVKAWCPETMARFACDCAERAKSIKASARGFIEDTTYNASIVDAIKITMARLSACADKANAKTTAYATADAANAAAYAALGIAQLYDAIVLRIEGYDAERTWQARRLGELLHLDFTSTPTRKE